jgi:hypothetical protein
VVGSGVSGFEPYGIIIFHLYFHDNVIGYVSRMIVSGHFGVSEEEHEKLRIICSFTTIQTIYLWNANHVKYLCNIE